MKDPAKCVMHSSQQGPLLPSHRYGPISLFWDSYFTGEIQRKYGATDASSPRTIQSLGAPGLLWSFRATCSNPLPRNEGLSLGWSFLLRGCINRGKFLINIKGKERKARGGKEVRLGSQIQATKPAAVTELGCCAYRPPTLEKSRLAGSTIFTGKPVAYSDP